MCDEAVFVNAGRLRVPCKVLDTTHEVHVGQYRRPDQFVSDRITWSGPVGATVIDPPEIEPWPTPVPERPRKPWEKPS